MVLRGSASSHTIDRTCFHFITYSNEKEPYNRNAETHIDKAIDVGFSSALHAKESELKETEFWRANSKILEQKRGAGYWLWKPYIIRRRLAELRDEDILFYSDAGTGLSHQKNFFDTIPMTLASVARKARKGMVSGASLDWMTQARFTKGDCFELMGANTVEMHNAPQVNATWSIWRPTQDAFLVLDQWLDYACDPRILTDQADELATPQWDFQEHRHDQSVISILTHKHGAAYLALHRKEIKSAFTKLQRKGEFFPDTRKSIRNMDRFLASLFDLKPGQPIERFDQCPCAFANLEANEDIPDQSAIRNAAYPLYWIRDLGRLISDDPSSIEWKHAWSAMSAEKRALFKKLHKGKKLPEVLALREDLLARLRLRANAPLEHHKLNDTKLLRFLVDDCVVKLAAEMNVAAPPKNPWSVLSANVDPVELVAWRTVSSLGQFSRAQAVRSTAGGLFVDALEKHEGDPAAAYTSVAERMLELQRELAEGPEAVPHVARWHEIWRAAPYGFRADWAKLVKGLRGHEVLPIVEAAVSVPQHQGLPIIAPLNPEYLSAVLEAAEQARCDVL